MVLGIRLILPLVGAISACSAAPGPSPVASSSPVSQADGDRPALDHVQLGGTDLTLVAAGDGCALRIDRTIHPLGLSAPCRFLRRNHSPEATVENYGGYGRVVMVIAAPAPAADYDKSMAETTADRCASAGRPVLELDRRFALGEVMRSPAGYCPDIGLDEKFYYGIAHARPFAAREQLR